MGSFFAGFAENQLHKSFQVGGTLIIRYGSLATLVMRYCLCESITGRSLSPLTLCYAKARPGRCGQRFCWGVSASNSRLRSSAGPPEGVGLTQPDMLQ